MAIDFPNSPTVGMTWPNPAVTGQPVYTWDGEKWTSGTGFGNIYISDSAPAAPVGSLWWQSSTGFLFVSYNDGNSIQWVAVAGGPADVVLYSTVQALTTLQQAQARSNIGLMKKNYILNGAMQVSQENGSTLLAASGNIYPVDMFVSPCSTAAGALTAQQIASRTPGGSPNRIQYKVTTASASVAAGDVVQIIHRMEGLRVADLMLGTATPKTVTLQFGCKGPAGTYCVSFSNLAAVRAYVAPFTIAAGEANTDVVKSITLPLDNTGVWPIDNTVGLDLRWFLMGGSGYQTATPNTWISVAAGTAYCTSAQFNFLGTVGNTFELFDVGLYEGPAAPPFMVPDFASELALCRRYYWTSKPDPNFPSIIGNAFTGTAYVGNTFSFPTPMRAAPTIAVVGTWATSNVTGAPTLWVIGPNGFALYLNATAAGNVTTLPNSATAGVTANARLL